jgi:hypothetical protein
MLALTTFCCNISPAADDVKSFMVSIRDITRNVHVCTGTLAKSNFVLTSANCVATHVANNLMVWIGPDNLVSPQAYDYLFVKEKICHPMAAEYVPSPQQSRTCTQGKAHADAACRTHSGQVQHDVCLLKLSGDTWATPAALDVNVQVCDHYCSTSMCTCAGVCICVAGQM